MGEVNDGKVRLRCPGCGKRVKFPAGQPGQTFRCPLCHTTIVAPINGAEADAPSKEELAEAAAAVPVTAPPPDAPPSLKPAHAASATPAAPPPRFKSPPAQAPERRPVVTEDPIADVKNAPMIDRINAFLVRETQRTGRVATDVLGDAKMSLQEQIAYVKELRRGKAVRFKVYVESLLKDLDGEIAALRENPAVDTPTVKSRLTALLNERRGVLIYLNIMFELKPPPPAAKPGAPAAEPAPPSSPSKPAARTPPGTPSAAPAPGTPAPDSSASPPC
jgi:ribosomal protein S27E